MILQLPALSPLEPAMLGTILRAFISGITDEEVKHSTLRCMVLSDWSLLGTYTAAEDRRAKIELQRFQEKEQRLRDLSLRTETNGTCSEQAKAYLLPSLYSATLVLLHTESCPPQARPATELLHSRFEIGSVQVSMREFPQSKSNVLSARAPPTCSRVAQRTAQGSRRV